jgi:hypothetical protein
MQTALEAWRIFGDVAPGEYAVDGVEWKVAKASVKLAGKVIFSSSWLEVRVSASCRIAGQRFAVTADGRVFDPDQWNQRIAADRVSLAVGRDDAASWSFGGYSGDGSVVAIENRKHETADPRLVEIAASGIAAIAAARAVRIAEDDRRNAAYAAKDEAKRARQEADMQARIAAALDRIRK